MVYTVRFAEKFPFVWILAYSHIHVSLPYIFLSIIMSPNCKCCRSGSNILTRERYFWCELLWNRFLWICKNFPAENTNNNLCMCENYIVIRLWYAMFSSSLISNMTLDHFWCRIRTLISSDLNRVVCLFWLICKELTNKKPY